MYIYVIKLFNYISSMNWLKVTDKILRPLYLREEIKMVDAQISEIKYNLKSQAYLRFYWHMTLKKFSNNT